MLHTVNSVTTARKQITKVNNSLLKLYKTNNGDNHGKIMHFFFQKLTFCMLSNIQSQQLLLQFF